MLKLLTTSEINIRFFIVTTCGIVIVSLFGNGNCLTFIKKEKYNITLQVKTSNGIVQGYSRRMDNDKDIFIYTGIPFAAPPLYNLRFRDPQPQRKWPGVLDVRQQAPSCVQLVIRIPEITVNGVEDCLYLNVYSPIRPRSNETIPVLFWIHGGSFIEGDASIYNPEYFVEENVVVVTANYRLGMFGFLSTEDEASPGNYALKDQNAVLKWIQKNIKNFGGDPNRVTIMGESAGACSVIYHMVSTKSKGLFHGAVAMSGTTLAPWCLQRHPGNVAMDISVHMGLSMENTTVFVEALRKMSSEQLMHGQATPILVNLAQIYHNGLPFTPVVEPVHKDAFVTESSFTLLENGKFAKVPLVIGTTSMEIKLFENAILLIKPLISLLYELSPSFVPVGMNIPSFLQRRIVGHKIKNQYFPGGSIFSASQEELFQYLTDVFFIKSSQKSVELISKHVPVYTYVFDYEGQIGIDSLKSLNQQITRNVKGVAHAEDLAYIWKRLDMNEQDKLTKSRMIRMWTDFIKFGNPTPEIVELLQNVTWPPSLVSDSTNYLHIGKNLSVRQNYRGRYKKFWADVFNTYCQKPFYTY